MRWRKRQRFRRDQAFFSQGMRDLSNSYEEILFSHIEVLPAIESQAQPDHLPADDGP